MTLRNPNFMKLVLVNDTGKDPNDSKCVGTTSKERMYNQAGVRAAMLSG
jgi:hypothetical protein